MELPEHPTFSAEFDAEYADEEKKRSEKIKKRVQTKKKEENQSPSI